MSESKDESKLKSQKIEAKSWALWSRKLVSEPEEFVGEENEEVAFSDQP